MDEPMTMVEASPSMEKLPAEITFEALVDRFCEDMAEFRAILALMGARGADTRQPPRRDPDAIREP